MENAADTQTTILSSRFEHVFENFNHTTFEDPQNLNPLLMRVLSMAWVIENILEPSAEPSLLRK
jgi:hypothetical protein